MKLAVAYCRVSTDHKEQQLSITEQKKQWAEFFKNDMARAAKCGMLYYKDGRKKILTDGIYADEGISGTSLRKREAFKQMIADGMLKKFDVIYVEDISRFSRSAEDGLTVVKDLREKGVAVYFRKEGWDTLDTSKDFELQLRMAIAEEESRVKSTRLRWAMNRLHLKGGWNSYAPFGYDIEKSFLKVNENEAKTVQLIFSLYLEQGYGVGKVARYLNDNNIPTKKGCKWSQTQITGILKNKIYIGIQTTHTVETDDLTRHTRKAIPEEQHIVHNFPYLRIVEDDTFINTQLEYEKRSGMFTQGTRHSNKYLLSTLLYCAECGGCYKRKKRHTYTRLDGTAKDIGFEWTCGVNDMYGQAKCGHRNMLVEDSILAAIKKEIQARQNDDLTPLLEMYKSKKVDECNVDPAALHKQLEDLNGEMRELRQDKRDKLIGEEIYKKQMQQLAKEMTDIEAALSRHSNQQAEIGHAEKKFKDYLRMLETVDIENITNTQLKQIFRRILVKGRINDGKKKIYVSYQYNFMDMAEDELFKYFGEQLNSYYLVEQ